MAQVSSTVSGITIAGMVLVNNKAPWGAIDSTLNRRLDMDTTDSLDSSSSSSSRAITLALARRRDGRLHAILLENFAARSSSRARSRPAGFPISTFRQTHPRRPPAIAVATSARHSFFENGWKAQGLMRRCEIYWLLCGGAGARFVRGPGQGEPRRRHRRDADAVISGMAKATTQGIRHAPGDPTTIAGVLTGHC